MNILVGYHYLYDPSPLDGYHCVIYQLEQLSEKQDQGWFTSAAFEVLKRAQTVWDYSLDNVRFLRDKGLRDVRYLPLGFHERLQTINENVPRDIDVLFYGSTNERRCHILRQLETQCRLESLYGVYGPQRDAYIARSKIVLNIHFHGMQIMEQVRITYLLNNGCFVVSEDSAQNPFEGMVVVTPYDRIVQTCLDYLPRDHERKTIAAHGMELFRRQPMAAYLDRALSSDG